MQNNIENNNDIHKNLIKERRKRIFSLRSLILFVFSLFLILFLISRLEIEKTIVAFHNANIKLVILGTFTYCASNFFKTLRFQVLLKDFNLKISHLFTIVSYHNFFNQIFPARTGELTLVYYLKKIGKVDIAKGLHSLLIARIFDLIIVSFFFVVSILIYYGKETSKFLVIFGSIAGIVSTIIMLKLGVFIQIFHSAVNTIAYAMKVNQKPFIIKVLQKLEEVINEFKTFDAKKRIPLLIITSFFVWTALYLLSYISIKVFAVEISYLQSIIGSTGAVLTNVLPINSFGSFGTLEAGWTGGFVFIGMSESDAITTGFGCHIITFFSSGFIALCSFIFYSIISSKKI